MKYGKSRKSRIFGEFETFRKFESFGKFGNKKGRLLVFWRDLGNQIFQRYIGDMVISNLTSWARKENHLFNARICVLAFEGFDLPN